MLKKLVSNPLRAIGKTLEAVGSGFQGRAAAQSETSALATGLVPAGGKHPQVAKNVFVAPNASVIGDVEVGEGSSIWYGATIRGDVNHVRIGNNSTIGDRAVIHVAKFANDFPTIIGNDVVVGANATVHAATLQDGCQIGIGAQVLDGAVVEKGAIVGPGALVPPGKTVPKGQLWAGIPAKEIKALSEVEIDNILLTAEEAHEVSKLHAAEQAKTAEQVAEEEDLEYALFDKRSGDLPTDQQHLYRKGLIFENLQEQERAGTA